MTKQVNVKIKEGPATQNYECNFLKPLHGSWYIKTLTEVTDFVIVMTQCGVKRQEWNSSADLSQTGLLHIIAPPLPLQKLTTKALSSHKTDDDAASLAS